MLEIELTPASLGMYNVFSRDTKRGLTYDVKRLIGFVFTTRGEIIRPCWQRVFTQRYAPDAVCVCHAFNAVARGRFGHIKIVECNGGSYAVYLSGVISDGVRSRINYDTITKNMSAIPLINPTTLKRDLPWVFTSFDVYVAYCLYSLCKN